eukprot:scaffold1147_cov250-Pinguiococcus_pyrenoidosus.AAC.11
MKCLSSLPRVQRGPSRLAHPELGLAQVRVDGEVVWDRVVDGGFPGPKELKQRVRNIIAPDQDLGHIDSGGSGRSGGARASLATPSTSEAPASAGTKTVISSDRAPAAVGAYSQAIRAGNLLFCSGQVGLDPATGKLAPGGVAAEAEQAMTNLREVVEAAGGSLQGSGTSARSKWDGADGVALHA